MIHESNPTENISLISHSAIIPEIGTHKKHMHYTNELLLFIRGDASYMIDGNQFFLRPYDLLIIPKGIYHCVSVNSRDVYENYVINFYDSILPDDILNKVFSPPCVFNIKNDNTFLNLFESLDRVENTYTEQEQRISFECILKEMLIYSCYYERISTPLIKTNNPYIEKALNYISQNICENINADSIAFELKISASHLQNVFSEYMHIGLKQYIAQKKIIKAKEIIESGISANETALFLGFNDYSTFYRLFKKTVGISPSESKKCRRNECIE